VAEFEAFVLTGGGSERMGRDKALLAIDGTPMALRVADALERAGATRVRCVGGDRTALRAVGLDVVDDDHPGAGPLGGILTALRVSTAPVTLVSPCDLIEPPPDGFAALMAALGTTPLALVSVPSTDGAWRPLPCALRRTALAELGAAFDVGERAVHRAFAALERVEVESGPFPDADTPGDLPGRR